MTEPPPARAASVTIVTQTRIAPDQTNAFARWQDRVTRIVAGCPGFVKQTILPPSPPGQADWVILQSFDSTDAALGWLRSDDRHRLVAEAQSMLIGHDDVHLVADTNAGVLPAPASVVISTRIKPGQEAAYREWERRIAGAQARSPGFQGYRFEPPIPGVQDDWLTILRFDSEANLQIWLNSPERKKLVDEAAAFTEEYHTRIVRTGFDQWFHVGDRDTASPPAWKQNMVVLMTLYPVVMLITAWIEHPFLVGTLKMSHWSAIFIDNAISVLVLSFLTPLASRRLDWWLRPADSERKRDIAGIALVVCVYILCLLAFWQYETHIWRPW
jgi:antibiotic biosynthesis monooxygenase (ABM) superfamily enzyme